MSEPKHRDVELADRLDAEDRLRNRGYNKGHTCEKCCGFGQFDSVRCSVCDGVGYRWIAPITKEATTNE